MRTQLRTTPVVLLIAILGAVFTPRAAAQVEPIDPVWMVAARDTPLRCGELSTFYEVATLDRGDVVRVDGRNSRWARVIYPDDLFGFVRKEEAKDVSLKGNGTGTLTIAELSSIKAPNRISGLSGSWKRVYPVGDLKSNTPIEIIGEALSKDGQMVGYRVKPLQPPAVDSPPHGFVQLAALRDATKDEIDAHVASLKASSGAAKPEKEAKTPSEQQSADDASSTPADAEQSDGESGDTESPIEADSEAGDAGSESTPATNDTAEQAESGSAGETQPAPASTPSETSTTTPASSPASTPDDSLVDDMAIPTPEELAAPDNAAAEQAESGSAGESAPEAASSVASGSNAQQPAVTPQRRDYLLWEELEATLTRVRRVGGSTLLDSLDELIAEYERSLANTDTPTVRGALSNRLEWLRLRKTARDQRLALEAALRDAKQITVDARRQQEIWRTARGHDIVGRLVPSSIYDGTNLPLMYRIVVEGEAGLTRTIGYVRDDSTLNVGGLVGSIVGVAGEARYDDALRLRIITPTAIDRFQATGRP